MKRKYTNVEKRKDFDYFVKHNKEIHEAYGDCYVSIRNKQIIGIFSTEDEAIEVSSSQYGFGNFIVQRCTGTEDSYTNYVASSQLIKL